MVGALMPDRQLETESGTGLANGMRLFVSPRDSDGRIPRHVRTARRSEPHRNRSVDPGEAGGGRMLALAGASARDVPPPQAAVANFSNAELFRPLRSRMPNAACSRLRHFERGDGLPDQEATIRDDLVQRLPHDGNRRSIVSLFQVSHRRSLNCWARLRVLL